jgi:diguanylate cyclase (GGDEF)-like protein
LVSLLGMDYRTLFIFDIVSLAVYTVAITVIAFRNRRMLWLGWLAVSMLLELTQTMLQGLMGYERRSLTVLLPTLLNAASFFTMFKGFRWLMLREPARTQLGPMLLGTAMALYTVLYLRHVPNAFAVGMAPVFVASGLSLGLLLKLGRHHLKTVSRVTAGVLFAYMGVIIYRLLANETYAISPTDMRDTRSLISLLVMMLLGGCLALSYLWFYVAEICAELARTALLDPLTGVLNRRALEIEASREMSRAARRCTALSLILIDLDYFKRINDVYGHRSGDQALQALVRVVRGGLREIDLIARIGGEEFVLLLPCTGGECATKIAERLRGAIEDTLVSTETGAFRLTVSAGVTQMQPGDTSWEAMLRRGDEAMYEAKRSGRNRVVLDALPPLLPALPAPEMSPQLPLIVTRTEKQVTSI